LSSQPLPTTALAKFLRKPSFGRAPVPQNGSFGNLQQFCRLVDFQAPEKAALHHKSLPRIPTRELVQRGVNAQHVVLRDRQGRRFIEDDEHGLFFSATLLRLAAARRLNQKLAHGPSCNPLEVQPGGRDETRRVCELKPRFIYQCGRVQGSRGVATPDRRCKPPQFLVGDAEEIIQLRAIQPKCDFVVLR
jgi:hypothetical protein